MTDRPVDLSPLDPRGDRDRLERAVASILREAAPELARRRAPAGVLGWLDRWRRLGLAASAAVAILAALALLTVPRNASTSDGIGDSLGIPQPLAAWADSAGVPGPAELLTQLEDLP